ncbi:MAG: tRNA 2-thiouridine(34) synthase MnmA [Lachnospiraceae bacterium]|nr:tRNA 2-thiouridine(34) synthase MnmA [Lachnospiraceae bacterium]MBP5184296.1 tRNA 2-thiouridine(34) synthase MnmA [Lachnospiraceae bacterium]
MSKVIVGLSGGVDSAVAAYLLKVAGYDVIGVTLKNWESKTGEPGRCCEITEAQRIAAALDISYFVKNAFDSFREYVTEPFVREYACGRTPNPCVECNRYVKWDEMMQAAQHMGANYIATGHYATVTRLANGRYTVKQADHAEKDQTYMLYRLTQEQLAHTIMPLGKLSKTEVRKIAKEVGIPVANKPDSQEICFVPEGNYADFVEEEAGEFPAGNFVDEDGNILGKHKGIIHYTVGQRKGLGIAMGHPVFVKKIDAKKNEVVLSEEGALFSDTVVVNRLNFLGIEDIKEGEKIRARARIRYHHSGEWATLTRSGAETVTITFDSPVRAASPGQSAVFYDEDNCLLGGGIIV